MSRCDHAGFHSGVGKLSPEFEAVRFVVVCDACGEEIREVHVEHYAAAPEFPGDASERRHAA